MARVRVSISESLGEEPQAQLAFAFAVNLLARLSPVVGYLEVIVSKNMSLAYRAPKWREATMESHLRTLLSKLDPPLDWTIARKCSKQVELELCIGTGRAQAETIYIGTDGWDASVSPVNPLLVGPHVNPIGAYAAACLGVAEVFKRILIRGLGNVSVPVVPLDSTLRFSTLTYRTGSSEPNPPLPQAPDIGRLTLVGLGAGGGSTVYTLGSIPGMGGFMNLVEPDEFTEPNLNRYVFGDAADVGSNKTLVAKSLLRSTTQLKTESFTKPFSKARKNLPVEDLRHVISAVHSREARREIQYETPAVLWDAAAAEDGEFRVWRLILGESECMMCKHPSNQADPERLTATQLHAKFGMTEQLWLRKLRDNEAFDKAEVSRIADLFKGRNIEIDLPLIGQRFSDWYAEQCGRLFLSDLQDEIPIPFAPVLAGVLLAGEVIKEQYFPQFVLKSYYFNTLLGSFMRRQVPKLRLPRANCEFCADPVFRKQHLRRWGRSARKRAVIAHV